jgi:N-acetylmuramate 1-kinase
MQTAPSMPDALKLWSEDRLRAIGQHGPWQWEALPVEASYRRFFRVTATGEADGAASCVAMCAPPDRENNAQFVALSACFARAGIGVPVIHARDDDRGFFLMTDLGRRHLIDVYDTPARAMALAMALDTLVRIQRLRDDCIPPYTPERFSDELGLFREWFVRRWLGARVDDTVLAAVNEALLAEIATQPTCCVHRDFHCRNLLLRDDGSIGVVDFQDALVGPAAYDLASLLRDCYYRFDEAEIARWREAYLERTELGLDRERFPRQLDFTAVQRQLKAIGIFARLELRDGKCSHLPHILPVLEHVRDVAQRYPQLTPLADTADALVPAVRKRLGAPAR